MIADGHVTPGLPQRRPAADRGALRLPRLDPRRGARDDSADRRPGARRPRSARSRARLKSKRKREGKTAALLEQKRPNVFPMNVANIMPGDDVQVELRYTELLVPHDGRYELVFPTVVGPALWQRQRGERKGRRRARRAVPGRRRAPGRHLLALGKASPRACRSRRS